MLGQEALNGPSVHTDAWPAHHSPPEKDGSSDRSAGTGLA
jgi:hypothetical protein